jgi:hypothetical protein
MNLAISIYIFHVLIVAAALYVAAFFVKKAPFYAKISKWIPLILLGTSFIALLIWESIVSASFAALSALVNAVLATGLNTLGYEGIVRLFKKAK